MSLSGLGQLNLELTSRCNKSCSFCGHQDPTINTSLVYGDMDFSLLEHIRAQLEPGPIISWHRDGESTLYPRLREAFDLFHGFTTSLVTNGKNIGERAEDIIGRVTSCTVSLFRADPDQVDQLRGIKEFISQKGHRPPIIQLKIVGDMSPEELAPYEALGVPIIRRLIHVPIGNSKYAHRSPTVPEVGICLDALHRPTIDWQGHVYLCNRLDPQLHGYLGTLRTSSLDEIWNGPTRMTMIEHHKAGRRDLANPLCAKCDYWGVASA